MKTDQTTQHGANLADLLLILFIGLKLAGKIDWSWFWVLSPLWISLIVISGVRTAAKRDDAP